MSRAGRAVANYGGQAERTPHRMEPTALIGKLQGASRRTLAVPILMDSRLVVNTISA